MDKLWTVKDVANFLQLSTRSIYRMVELGHLPVIKLPTGALRFHDLRHTAATRWADAGADAFTIAALLGHATIQMSARYTHAIDQNKRRAVEVAGASQDRLKISGDSL